MLVSALFACNANLQTRYEKTWLTLFDTAITVVLYTQTERSAELEFERMHTELTEYHRLFDRYNSYDGINNIKTINDNAGHAPVEISPILMELLSFACDMHDATGGNINIALGSVLDIWHTCRENAQASPSDATVPDMQTLLNAAQHTDISALVLNSVAGTAYITESEMRIDVGAIAKGFAAQRVVENAASRGITSMLLNMGGNVCALGMRGDGEPWRIGIQDPHEPSKNIGSVELCDESLVTSGDYQRYFEADGVRYHHIIDPQTLMPATGYASVTVLCDNSAFADTLSTALFIGQNESTTNLAQTNNAGILYIYANGTMHVENMKLSETSP